jgi:molybdate transport system permease protein
MDWQAFWLTIRLAALVAAILLILGVPVAYWITFSRWRWKFLLEAMVALPIVMPPTVLGFYVLFALGPRTPLGRLWIAVTGHTLAFTFSGLVIGSILYSFPFAVQPFAASFGAVDATLLHASATLGASKLRTFLRVIMPLSVSGLASISIYDQVQAGNYGAANELALVLLAIAFLILSVVYGMNRRIWAIWPWK